MKRYVHWTAWPIMHWTGLSWNKSVALHLHDGTFLGGGFQSTPLASLALGSSPGTSARLTFPQTGQWSLGLPLARARRSLAPVGRPRPVLATGCCSRVQPLPWPCRHSAFCRVPAPSPALFPVVPVGHGRSRSLAGQQLAGSRGVGRAGAGGTPEAVPAAVTAREWPRAHLASKPGCSPGRLVPTAAAPANPATGRRHPAEIIAPSGGKKELFQGRVSVFPSSFCTNGKQNRLTLF